MTDNSAFEITRRPQRRYSRHEGFAYDGKTVFSLTPDPERSSADLDRLLGTVLENGPYTYGDWFDLPMPVYLVHDHDTRDVFRVAIRSGTIEFHVLPATESTGLSALYDRLRAASTDALRTGIGPSSVDGSTDRVRWHVERRTDET